MKKSKIIIPAAAILALSVGASVTGTVAWFTSSRTATITAANFASVKTSTSLVATVAGNADAGTEGTTQAIKVLGSLTHGSYNAVAKATGSLYVANLNDDETPAITSYLDLGTYASHVDTTATKASNKWKAVSGTQTDKSDDVWYGVGWTMTFKMKAATDAETNYLLLDNSSTGSTFTDGTTGGQTIAGLRIALMTDSKVLVLGGDETLTHTEGTSKESVKSFAGTDYAKISAGSAKFEDGASGISTSKYCFGELPANGTDTISMTCVAWFEGSDSSVVDQINKDDTVMSSVSASLAFYSRKA